MRGEQQLKSGNIDRLCDYLQLRLSREERENKADETQYTGTRESVSRIQRLNFTRRARRRIGQYGTHSPRNRFARTTSVAS